jgi:hypothetical protein
LDFQRTQGLWHVTPPILSYYIYSVLCQKPRHHAIFPLQVVHPEHGTESLVLNGGGILAGNANKAGWVRQ